MAKNPPEELAYKKTSITLEEVRSFSDEAVYKLIGDMVRQAALDYLKPKPKRPERVSEWEVRRFVAKWWFDHSTMFQITGLSKEYVLRKIKEEKKW